MNAKCFSEFLMVIILVFCFLLVFNGVFAEEKCQQACKQKYEGNTRREYPCHITTLDNLTFLVFKEQSGCLQGCKLALAYTILHSFESEDIMRERCHNGCVETYSITNQTVVKEACQFGCRSQQTRGSAQLTLTGEDAISGVVGRAMNQGWMPSQRLFGFEPFFGFSRELSDIWKVRERLMEAHEKFFQQLGFQNPSQRLSETGSFVTRRPHGHVAKSLEGSAVDNKDSNDDIIINAKPVKHQKVIIKVFTKPDYIEAPRMQKAGKKTSLVERLSQRANRMSILSQSLVAVALLLCLLSLIGIGLALIRHGFLYRMNVRQTRVILPSTIGDPLPTKKVPLEAPAASIDFPLIHDTPPPAYDQLSVHKEPQDRFQTSSQ